VSCSTACRLSQKNCFSVKVKYQNIGHYFYLLMHSCIISTLLGGTSPIWQATGGIRPAGRPMRLPETEVTCPDEATNWNGTAFSPATRLYYVIAP
jgi:hypothetical protein